MAGTQTASSQLDPAVKKEIDNILFEISRLDQQLKGIALATTSLSGACSVGCTTETPIEASSLISRGDVVICQKEYTWKLRIHPATGRLGLYAGEEKTPRQEW